MLLMLSCRNDKASSYAFRVLKSDRTGLKFANDLRSTDSFNLFKYMYFYNGAGVGVADFNNDGLPDIFFASNQGQNSMFLNQGGLKFKDVTSATQIPQEKGWSTGVSVTDINGDGLMDIYVCQVGKFRTLTGKNQFLICEGIGSDGVPRYADQASEMGVDFAGFSTQAAFLDYDMDGDLDLFLLNHSIHENGNFRPRRVFDNTSHPTAGNRLYQNTGGKFRDVTASAGIRSTAIGYGLGIAVSDINLDGFPDVYIGNDFHENDYLYINQRNGTFRDNSDSSLMHTSRYTMGVDIADANNDGLPEIFSVDMLPADPYILKRSPGEDSYDVFNLKISYGYNYQYTRNALQFNRGNGLFSEVALYSGVAATDWSWAPLWTDFDNDGLKDLFISNGIPKRLNDIDYINYVSDQSIQQQIRDNRLDEKDRALIDKFPQIKIPNKFYRNEGNLKFNDLAESIGDDEGTYSNGAAYADFDNDGDLDLVVNNIESEAILYQNTSNDDKDDQYLKIRLTGPASNTRAIGAMVVLYSGNQVRTYENYPVRGFLSSMDHSMHIGMNDFKPDSILLIWPDKTFEKLQVSGDRSIKASYKNGLPQFNYAKMNSSLRSGVVPALNLTDEVQLEFLHKENAFSEFNREPLVPHMISTEGPALAVADINKDGLDDVFIGGAKGKKRGLFLQHESGRFVSHNIPEMESDSNFEDVDALWLDVNSDTYPDLVIASGGNEYYEQDRHLLPRLFLNDGKGGLYRRADAFTGIFETQSCIATTDLNNDGHPDLFIGGRSVPWQYGVVPASYLLLNDGTGKFRDVTGMYSPALKKAGFVTGAVWQDINGDKRADLVLCSEWGTIDAYVWTNGKLERRQLSQEKGWWNFVLPVDVNGDGLVDIIAGNLGRNSRLHASRNAPVRLYYNDFDGNGKYEQMLTYYLAGKEVPFYNKAEMERQMPDIKKRFLYAKDFAVASLEDIMTSEKMESAELHSADYFSSAVLLNRGNLKFTIHDLPWQAQLSPMKDAVVVDANKDKFPDLLMVGNYFENNIEMGRYDADFGSVLLGDGSGGFQYAGLGGLSIKGQARKVQPIKVGGKEAVLVARNNDSVVVLGVGRK
jgi:enediyne biosynthesis protein E4